MNCPGWKSFNNTTQILTKSLQVINYLKEQLEKTQMEKSLVETKLANCKSELVKEVSKKTDYVREIDKLKSVISNINCDSVQNLAENDITFDISFDNEVPSPKRQRVVFDIPQSPLQKEVITPKTKSNKFSNFLNSAMKVKKHRTAALPKTISMESLNMKPVGPPFVPGAIVACMVEIESRGKDSSNIHMEVGSAKEVLKVQRKLHYIEDMNSLLAGCGLGVISTCMKQLISYVSEPLVTDFSRPSFVDLLKIKEPACRIRELCQSLPAVNRDTLAFLMIHLHSVCECGTKGDDLCKVFAPIVMGTSHRLDHITSHQQKYKDIQVMQLMMAQPDRFWNTLMTKSSDNINFGTFGLLGSYLKSHWK